MSFSDKVKELKNVNSVLQSKLIELENVKCELQVKLTIQEKRMRYVENFLKAEFGQQFEDNDGPGILEIETIHDDEPVLRVAGDGDAAVRVKCLSLGEMKSNPVVTLERLKVSTGHSEGQPIQKKNKPRKSNGQTNNAAKLGFIGSRQEHTTASSGSLIHTAQKRFVCDYQDCGKLFRRKDLLTCHKRTHTVEKANASAWRNKRQDTRRHAKENKFPCSYCTARFKANSDLVRHVRIHTGEKPYNCNYCEKAFRDLGHKYTHEKIHTGEKPFACKFCQAKFSQSHSLSEHLKRKHIKEKAFGCNFCAKYFVTSGDLNRHEIIHTGEKPFGCKFCQTQFSRTSNLNTHLLLIHIKEKSHFCQVCKKRFAQKSHLKDHERTHTCKSCGKTFSQLTNRNKHQKKCFIGGVQIQEK